jgi:hypothetical protein
MLQYRWQPESCRDQPYAVPAANLQDRAGHNVLMLSSMHVWWVTGRSPDHHARYTCTAKTRGGRAILAYKVRQDDFSGSCVIGVVRRSTQYKSLKELKLSNIVQNIVLFSFAAYCHCLQFFLFTM